MINDPRSFSGINFYRLVIRKLSPLIILLLWCHQSRWSDNAWIAIRSVERRQSIDWWGWFWSRFGIEWRDVIARCIWDMTIFTWEYVCDVGAGVSFRLVVVGDWVKKGVLLVWCPEEPVEGTFMGLPVRGFIRLYYWLISNTSNNLDLSCALFIKFYYNKIISFLVAHEDSLRFSHSIKFPLPSQLMLHHDLKLSRN